LAEAYGAYDKFGLDCAKIELACGIKYYFYHSNILDPTSAPTKVTICNAKWPCQNDKWHTFHLDN